MRPGRVRPSLDQMLGDGDVVGERGRLVGEPAGVVPGVALLAAAANVGDGIDEPAINQRQPLGAELRMLGVAVSAVAVQPDRRRAVELGVLVVEDGDGHAGAILSRRGETARDVARRVVAARHVLDLAQGALARLHVVVEHLLGLRQGLICVAQPARALLEPRLDLDLGRLLAEGDGVLGAVRPAANADLLAAALAVALEPDEVLAEDDEILDHAPGNVRNDLPQWRIGRSRHWLVGDLPVDGTVRIGEEDQTIAEVGDHILLSLPALGDGLRRPGRIGEIDQLDVGGREIAGLDHQEAVGQRQPQ